MTDVPSLSVDGLGDYLIENDIPSNPVLLFCGKRARSVWQPTTRVIFPLCDMSGLFWIIILRVLFPLHTQQNWW